MTDDPLEPQRPDLTAVDIRILGCLVEKQAASPESYPLTLNALVLACNQKTSREPLMQLAPGEVGQRLRALEASGLVRLVMGSRADRWEHRLDKALELVPAQVALLSLLFLRGPQTLADLFTRSSRLFAFDDVEQLRHQLERLAGRGYAQAIPRRPGQREGRYMHGWLDPSEVAEQPLATDGGDSIAADRIAILEARLAAVEERLAHLEGGPSVG